MAGQDWQHAIFAPLRQQDAIAPRIFCMLFLHEPSCRGDPIAVGNIGAQRPQEEVVGRAKKRRLN